MNSTELLNVFRDEMADTEEPYLWSSAAFYRYLDDAQKMFCRLTEGIEDSRTASVTELPVVAGTEWYDLSPLILKIRAARRTDTGATIELVPTEMADRRGMRFDGRQGPLAALVLGMQRNAARAWPKPNESVDLNLSVFRLPLERITDDGDQGLEIDEQHHTHLLLWVKHLAYSKQDAETFDRRKADEYEQLFRAYSARAFKEQERARHPAGTVLYGGI